MLHRTIATTAVAALCSAGLVTAAPPSSAAPPSRTATTKAAPQKAQAAGAGRYLVTFVDEPAASYEGGVAGYARTRPDTGKKLEPTRTEVVRWRTHLTAVHDAALQRVGATKLVDYTVATNGVAVELTAAQARSLAGTAGVVAMEKDALKTLSTTDSPTFLGIDDPQTGLWKQAGGQSNAGKGVIVGVVDSGIWPESASFAGSTLRRNKAGQPVDAQGLRIPWSGACVQGEQFDSQDCSDKLIGARYYVAGFGKQNIGKGEYLSPRDGGGHGSHTASTAAGNRVEHVTIDGTDLGTASGMAPAARVAAYKVCWEAKPGASAGCFNSDSVAAIDDAVADGVDVLNYSVGGSTESGPLDVVEQAFRRAANLGIFVANSAGNSGPDASTLDHPSPWLTTVAASTFRSSQKVLVLGNGQRYVGASITPGITSKPLVTSTAVGLAGQPAKAVAKCFAGALDPAKAAGKIVQCDRGDNDRIEKSFEVQRVGGLGMVLTNAPDSSDSLNSDFHPVPSLHVPLATRDAIKAYAALPGATAAIETLAATDPKPAAVPAVADFSSRGPSTTTGGDILKPDLAAPGVDVLAAVAPPSNHGRSYDFYSGTSMSSPHIAGLGAVLRGLHPTWSPAAVKSSLMTTAKDHADGADPFAQGAGFVRPNLASDPGLVFDASPRDYRRYMVGLGVQFAAPNDTLEPLDGTQLNQASLAIGQLAGREVVERTVTNVGTAPESYTVSEDVAGLDITAAAFSVEPGAAAKVALTVTRTTADLGAWAKGYVTFSGSAGHTVRIPVAVRPVAVSAPAEITGSGASGSQAYQVTPGYTGTLTPVVRGLVGVTPQTVTVGQGAYDSAAPAESAATKKFTVVVPADTPLVRLDVDATSTDDLDLYVYGPDGTLVDLSASAAGDERVTLTDPAAGTYTAYVNGYDTAAGGGVFAWTAWIVPAAAAGNLTVTGGGPAVLAEPLTLTAAWTGLDVTKRWLGYVGYAGAPDRTVVTIG